MSKTIIIPKYNDPFTVVINNEVYQYKGGETVEVPDDVAEAIEDALDLVPKPKRYLNKLAQFAEGSITEITLSDLDGIEVIVPFSLSHCKSVVKATIPNSVKEIQNHAFYSCSCLESVDMGKGVQRIKGSVFDWCVNLAKVYLPEIPPALDDVTAFNNIKAGCVFYCKTQASLDAYKTAPIWSTLTGTYSFVVEE